MDHDGVKVSDKRARSMRERKASLSFRWNEMKVYARSEVDGSFAVAELRSFAFGRNARSCPS